MSTTNYAGTATFHTTIPVFDDAEPPRASAIVTPMQALQDNCKYLGRKAIFWESFSTYSETTTTDTVNSASWGIVGASIVDLPTTVALGDLIDIHASARFYGGSSLVRLTFYGGAGGATVLQSVGPVSVDNGVVTIMGRITADAAVVSASGLSTLHVHFESKQLSGSSSTMMLPVNSYCAILRNL